MPHLTLEYTNNLHMLDVRQVLQKLNQALIDSGQFAEFDIKSRAIRLEVFAVGEVLDGRAFVHVTLAILSGRTPEVKSDLSHRLLGTLAELCPSVADIQTQLCVEIQDIDRDSYAKLLI